MKLPALALALCLVLVFACNQQQKRNDWRSPAPTTTCASDAECRGGTCAIEMGATQGTCSGSGALPPLPAADGGASPAGPNVQPSPSDIHL